MITRKDQTHARHPRLRVTPLRMALGVVALLGVGLVWAWFLTGELKSFKVISRSMVPTLEIGDYVLMRRAARDADLRGRVVAFDNPQVPGETLTKRVIAAEGDEVVLSGGFVRVNGHPEARNAEKIVGTPDGRWRLGPDQVFVLGDNRNDSFDSIDMGPVPSQFIRGVLVYRYWPRARAGRVE